MKSVNDFVRNILKNAVSSELCNTVDIHYNYYYKAVVLILARHSWAVCISANISSLSLLRLFSASETDFTISSRGYSSNYSTRDNHTLFLVP